VLPELVQIYAAIDTGVNRYYFNAYGRFMTPDSYQKTATSPSDPDDPQSWNRYAYSHRDSVNHPTRSPILVRTKCDFRRKMGNTNFEEETEQRANDQAFRQWATCRSTVGVFLPPFDVEPVAHFPFRVRCVAGKPSTGNPGSKFFGNPTSLVAPQS
jgi:hypothetical protein